MDVPGSPCSLIAYIQGRRFAFDTCTHNEVNENESKHSLKTTASQQVFVTSIWIKGQMSQQQKQH